MFWKKLVLTYSVGVISTSIILAGCISQTGAPNISPTNDAARPTLAQNTPILLPLSQVKNEYFIPPYYTNAYEDIIEASKNEQELIIYSVFTESSWKSVIETFKGHYPWIKVTIVDLGASEVFERYTADSISGDRNADLILSYAPDGWLNFANSGQIEPYLSEEDFYVPPWTKLAPGIYTIASDPMVILYNKEELPNPPQRMVDIKELIESDPNKFSGKITSYDASQNSTGLAINWFWINKLGETGWDILNRLGKTTPLLKTSSSSMVSSILSGESIIGVFISPISFLSEQDSHPELGWTYIKDGQPILMRSIAITKQAKSPNSAKLMVDFLLSQEGQIALALGGLTPFRPDIANVDIFNSTDGNKHYIHFNQVIEDVGLDNLIFITLDPEIINSDKRAAFIEKWNHALGR
jgi:iron(III) transport system substrate-binding protein